MMPQIEILEKDVKPLISTVDGDSLRMIAVASSSLVIGLGATLGFAFGGFYLMGDSWMSYNDIVGSYYTMTTPALVGVYLVIMSIALGPTLLGHSLLSISRLRSLSKSYIPAFLLSTIAAISVIGVILAGVYLIDAFSPYIWYQPQDGVPKLNTLNQLLGCLIVSMYSLFSIAALMMAGDSLGLLPKEKPLTSAPTYSIQPNNQFVTKFNLLNFLVLFLSFAFIFVLTLFLPHVWAITNMSVVAWNAYFVVDSPYSLIHGVLLYESDHQHFAFQNITTMSQNLTYVAANRTMVSVNITTTTLELLPDPDWLQPKVYLKLYETVVVYYSMIFAVVTVGIVGTYNSALRQYLHKRVNMCFIPKVINLWPVGASIGELSLTAAVIALHCYWFWYWAVGWGYRPVTSGQTDAKMIELETYARVMGQMAVLTMSFLTFPVARNSVWESVFGVPFDRAIKYHRTLGALFWVFVTLHMLIYQAKWIQNGILERNAWAEPNNWIQKGTAENPLVFRNSNWTIPLMEFTWLLSTVALSMALLRTTYRYELFVYTHFFMAAFLILAFMHSFQSWYYTGAGLLLYAFDKIIRNVNASRQHTMLSVVHHKDSGVTRITLPGGTFRSGHIAGQFCWIQIPAVHALEWHPFTISSSPSSALGDNGTVCFSIKALTPGSWTHRLSEFADKINSSPSAPTPALMDIAMDGPYGRSTDYSMHGVVVLVAGGIGVTPMMSIFDELVGRMGDAKKGGCGRVKEVHLVWSIREASLFDLFAEEVLRPLKSQVPGIFVHLYITGTPTFPVLGVEEILDNVQRKKEEIKCSMKEEESSVKDQHRSVLNGDMTFGRDIENTMLDCKRDILKIQRVSVITEASSRHGSSNTLLMEVESVPVASRLVPLHFTAGQLTSSAPFTVTFGRPNYAELFDKVEDYNMSHATDYPSIKTMTKIIPLGGERYNPEPETSDVACLVCAPFAIVDSVSQQCYRMNWTFQAEEFTI